VRAGSAAVPMQSAECRVQSAEERHFTPEQVRERVSA
jgi:hypothetical protein